MKTGFILSTLMAAIFCFPPFVWSAEAPGPRTSWQENPADEAKGAEKDVRQAGKEFTGAAQQDITPLPAPTPPAQVKTPESAAEPKQQTSKKSFSATQRKTVTSGTNSAQAARNSAMVGSPETGYAGTWVDPANGDIVTSVIAPNPAPQTTTNYPIIIEPQVNPSDWNSGGSGWNTGWGSGYWPQGPMGYPNDPPPPPGAYPPPGGNPNFMPGAIPSFPPPNAPGYRPLRPGHGWPGANPGMMPPNSGWQPGMPPAGPTPGGFPPNFQPGANPPAGPTPGGFPPNFQPGANPPGGWQPGRPPAGPNPGGFPPNFQPGANPPMGPPPGVMGPSPNFRPLPMRPGGHGWRPGQSGGRAPLFGRGGM